ncbi:hypothetical protein ACMFMG_010739 [Clarireedia jacksonii]
MSSQIEKRTFAVTNSGQRTLIIVPAFLLCIASVAVVLRFEARRLKKSRPYIDDYLCVLALLLAYGGYIANLVMVLAGGGATPVTGLTRPELIIWFKGLVSNYVFWVSATAATQLSILFFYVRLFGVKQWFRIALYVSIFIVSAWWISAFISEVTACIPLAAAWTPHLKGTCINDEEMCTAVGMLHVVFDFLILILPIPLIWGLQMSVWSRTIVSLVLSVGVFASVCSILRMACLINLGDNPKDKTGEWLAMIYQVIEAPIGIFCICVPNLTPVWKQISLSSFGSKVKLLFSSRSRSTSDTGGSGSIERSSFKQIKSSGSGLSRSHDDRSLGGESDQLPLQDIETGSMKKPSK